MTTAPLQNRLAPSATPTEAEIAAWQDLPRDKQVRRLREALTSPEATSPCETTMDEIWAEISAEIEADAPAHG